MVKDVFYAEIYKIITMIQFAEESFDVLSTEVIVVECCEPLTPQL